MNHAGTRSNMLTGPQQRILRWLCAFPPSLEKAWDVERSLSLPGISEGLGVVRSAIHSPITKLEKEGLVFSRMAHVIGGGRRRRKVFHITEAGRGSITLEEPKEAKVGSLVGSTPPLVELSGRDKEKSCIPSTLITGLPGIGKSALLRNLAEAYANKGEKVAWIRISAFDGIPELMEQVGYYGSSNDSQAAAMRIARDGHIVVIDEIQDVHERHKKSIEEFVSQLITSGVPILIGSRAPPPFEIDIETLTLDMLDPVSALELLPEDIGREEAELIVERLGGHPLALNLLDRDAPLPEVGKGVRDYVKSTVLARLDDEAKQTLDELSLLPVQVNPEDLQNQDGLEMLDESALLKWENGVELQHLIRNVRRAMLSEDELKQAHTLAASHWQEVDGEQGRLIEFHHMIQSNDPMLERRMMDELEGVCTISPSAMASLLEDACNRNPRSRQLKRLAAVIAIERNESNLADNIISELPDGPAKNQLLVRTALLKGDIASADSLFDEMESQLSGSELLKVKLNRLVIELEDRSPGVIDSELFSQILSKCAKVNVSEADEMIRRSALQVLSMVKHRIYLAQNEMESAQRVLSELKTVLDEDNRHLSRMELLSRIYSGEDVEIMTEDLDSQILLLAIAEHSRETNPEKSKQIINRLIEMEYPLHAARRRVLAAAWTWLARVDESQRLTALREAISHWKAAGCPRAAAATAEELHRLL